MTEDVKKEEPKTDAVQPPKKPPTALIAGVTGPADGEVPDGTTIYGPEGRPQFYHLKAVANDILLRRGKPPYKVEDFEPLVGDKSIRRNEVEIISDFVENWLKYKTNQYGG